MKKTQPMRRWQEQNHKVSNQEILETLRSGEYLGKIKRLESISYEGVEYFDLSGISIEGEVLNISHLTHVDFSHARLENVQFISDIPLSNLRFESANLKNISFKRTTTVINERITLKDFIFDGARIEKSNFSEINFLGRNSFRNLTFNEVDFSESCFEKSVFADFFKSRFYRCILIGTNLNETCLSDCFFINSDLRDASFEKTNLSNIEFKDCFVNSKTAFDEKVILEGGKSFEKAAEVYSQLKIMFSRSGHYQKSKKYHVRKMISLRKVEKNPFRKLASWIYWLTTAYGESPFRIMSWMAMIIVLFAFGYLFSDVAYAGKAENVVKDFGKCLYFSTVTFTTLGYGDWVPSGSTSRVLAGIESFSGLFFLAIFSVLISKKMTRE